MLALRLEHRRDVREDLARREGDAESPDPVGADDRLDLDRRYADAGAELARTARALRPVIRSGARGARTGRQELAAEEAERAEHREALVRHHRMLDDDDVRLHFVGRQRMRLDGDVVGDRVREGDSRVLRTAGLAVSVEPGDRHVAEAALINQIDD